MFIMYFMVLGIAAFGGEFIKLSIVGISFTYITMAALGVSYFRYFFLKNGRLRLDRKTKAIIIFEIYGLLMVLCSFIGINKFFISSDLYTNVRYIPRQAYYLVVLPALILMREEVYMIPLKKFINKYGNFLFWLIYVIQIFSNGRFCISVSSVLVLAGFALYNGETRRTVRNMMKFSAIMLTPVAGGGGINEHYNSFNLRKFVFI